MAAIPGPKTACVQTHHFSHHLVLKHVRSRLKIHFLVGKTCLDDVNTYRVRIPSDVFRPVQRHHHVLSDREIQVGHIQICAWKSDGTLHELMIVAIVVRIAAVGMQGWRQNLFQLLIQS